MQFAVYVFPPVECLKNAFHGFFSLNSVLVQQCNVSKERPQTLGVINDKEKENLEVFAFPPRFFFRIFGDPLTHESRAHLSGRPPPSSTQRAPRRSVLAAEALQAPPRAVQTAWCLRSTERCITLRHVRMLGNAFCLAYGRCAACLSFSLRFHFARFSSRRTKGLSPRVVLSELLLFRELQTIVSAVAFA